MVLCCNIAKNLIDSILICSWSAHQVKISLRCVAMAYCKYNYGCKVKARKEHRELKKQVSFAALAYIEVMFESN